MDRLLFAGMMLLGLFVGCWGTAEALDITGTVVDETGKPVSGAKLAVLDTSFPLGPDHILLPAPPKVAVSGNDGSFLLHVNANAPWECLFVAACPGFGLTFIDDLKWIKKANRWPVKVVMEKGGSIQGRVVNAVGKPVQDALITVWLPMDYNYRTPMDPSLLSTRTDRNGVYKLDGLPKDVAVLVYATHPDYLTGIAGATGDPRSTITGPVPVGSTDTLITLFPGVSISGHVVWENTRKPAASIAVLAVPENKNPYIPFWTAETDEKGFYCIKNLMPGKYILRNNSDQAGLIIPKSVEVSQASPAVPLDLTATSGIMVAGKCVYTDTKEPVNQGTIMFCSKTNPIANRFYAIQPDGSFRGCLEPGEWDLRGSVTNCPLALPSLDNCHLEMVKDNTDFVLEFGPFQVFRGRVLDVAGNPVQGACIKLRNALFDNQAFSDASGCFQLQTAETGIGQFSSIVFDVTHPDRPDLRGRYAVSYVSKDDLSAEVILKPVSVIRGRVVDAGGNPMAGTPISTSIKMKKGSGHDSRVLCDTAGQFEISDAMGGCLYLLDIKTPQHGGLQLSTLTEPGKTTDLGTLILPVLDKTLEGTVRDTAGRGVEGVYLSCRGGSTGRRIGFSDAAGHFRFDQLANESLDLFVSYFNADGRKNFSKQVMAGDDEVEMIVTGQNRNPSEKTVYAKVSNRRINKEADSLEGVLWDSGAPVTLEQLRGKPVILAFYKKDAKAGRDGKTPADLCSILVQSMEKYPGLEVVIICPASSDMAALKQMPGTNTDRFHIAWDQNGTSARKYSVQGASASLIDPEGKLVFHDLAFSALEAALTSMLTPLLTGSPIPTQAMPEKPDLASAASDALTYVTGEEVGSQYACLGNCQSFETTLTSPKPLTAEPVYRSRRPRYGAMQLGPDKDAAILFAVDESRGTRTGFDTLYIDSNGNRDLTDDVPVQGPFPVIAVKVKYGDMVYPYHARPEISGNDVVTVRLETQCVVKGTFTLGRKQFKAELFDSTGNACFNDAETPIGDVDGYNLGTNRGDVVLVDFDQNGMFDRDNNQGAEIFPFGKYWPLGNKCYEMNLAPSGRTVSLAKTKVPCGNVVLQSEGANMSLVNREGAIFLHERKSVVPAGTYQFYGGSVDMKDAGGNLWRVGFSSGLYRKTPIVVTAGKTTRLHAGAPFLAELDLFTVEKNKPVLVLNIRDQEGECYYFESFRNVGESKTKLEQPSLRIVDQEGREVAQGRFENNRRFVWQVPDTLKGEFTAIPEVHVGPFPIKMVPKVIHLK